jgi:hypothetical protein
MSEDHHFLINGMRWLVRFTRLRGRAAGWAYLPDAKNPFSERKILVDSRLKNRAKLETVVHEILHVCFPTVSEEHITLSARDLARALWALGYREKE